MAVSHGGICKGIGAVGLEALGIGAVAEQVCTEDLQLLRSVRVIQLGVGIGCNAVFVYG